MWLCNTALQVSDSEIKDYIKKHEKQFKQEAYRNIQYIVINEKPSDADLAEAKSGIEKLLQPEVVYNVKKQSNDTVPGFATTKEIKSFVDRYSDKAYDSTFVTKDKINSAYADTLFALGVGKIYGPYEEDGSIKISRKLLLLTLHALKKKLKLRLKNYWHKLKLLVLTLTNWHATIRKNLVQCIVLVTLDSL